MHRYRRFSCGLTADAARLAEKRGRLLPSFRGTLTRYPSPVRLALQVHAGIVHASHDVESRNDR